MCGSMLIISTIATSGRPSSMPCSPISSTGSSSRRISTAAAWRAWIRRAEPSTSADHAVILTQVRIHEHEAARLSRRCSWIPDQVRDDGCGAGPAVFTLALQPVAGPEDPGDGGEAKGAEGEG